MKEKIIFYLLFSFIYLLSVLPLFILYIISDLFFLIVFYLIKYRKRIVFTNIQNAFPEKTNQEHQKIAKKFYQYFCDLIIETIKSFSITSKQIHQRCKFHNAEIMHSLYAKKKHVILTMGHFGNWEWAGNSLVLTTPYQLYAIYQPFSNQYIDKLIYIIRSRFGRKLIKKNYTLKSMVQYTAPPKATAFLADQTTTANNAYITTFLNQLTYIFKGTEKIAKKLDHAVVYVGVKKIKRGYYTIYLDLITEDASSTAENEISLIHTQKLEKDIIAQPEIWLWSHKRWKSNNI